MDEHEHGQSGGSTAVSPSHDALPATPHDEATPTEAGTTHEGAEEEAVNFVIVAQKTDAQGTDSLAESDSAEATTAVTTTEDEQSTDALLAQEGDTPPGDERLDVVSPAPPPEEPVIEWEECHVTEARIELRESHALTVVNQLLESMNEGFRHTHFDENSTDGWMFDEYANHWFVVTYCLNADGRDQVRVRWIDAVAEEAHNDGELPALARYIARSLGGGSNLHLLDSVVRIAKR